MGAASGCGWQHAAVVACLLLLLSSGVLAQHKQAPEQPIQQVDPSQLVEVQAYPITQLPGCKVAKGNSLELPAGLLDNCVVDLKLSQSDPQLLVFAIPDNTEMSVVLTLNVQGGSASMSVWYPGSSVEGPPDLIQNELYTSPAASEGWISLPPEAIVSRPGNYLVAVSAFSGTPFVSLRVATPAKGLQLVDEERLLLQEVAGECCQGVGSDSKVEEHPFCMVIAPESLAPEHSWTTDLCHLAPSSCNAAGQLTRLALPGLGLRCPSGFPQALGRLPSLRRLDLSGNRFGEATVEEVAAVVSGLPELEELALGSTGLSGSLTCDLATPSLKILDLAYNRIEGKLPTCLLDSLRELFVPGNALTGALPGPAPSSPLVTLYANLQAGGGLTGTIPVSLVSLRSLAFINLAGNSLSGALPGLPKSIKLLNISSNSVSGRLGSLPSGLWQLDVSDNALSGPLPPLAGLAELEVAVISGNRMEGTLPALPPQLHHLEAVGAGLSGPLPPLPPHMTRLDLSDNAFSGTLPAIDTTHLEVLRASNNSLSGPLPAGAATSPRMFLLDLSGNRLSGSLPATWSAPRMQMVMLQDNALTGTIPPGLASLPKLGVLRLGHNKLAGSLEAFGAALTDPAAAAAAATSGSSSSTRKATISALFDFNVTGNALSGLVPDSLAWLGVFNPNITILVPGGDGAAVIAPRVLDLSDNRLAGPWPSWLLKAVPSTTSMCGCSLSVSLSGPDMALTCPSSSLGVSDYMWQTAAEQRYTCWDAKEQQQEQLLDLLTSPANGGPGKADRTSIARGDGGGMTAQAGRSGASAGAVAGAVIGVVAGLTLLGLVGYFVVYKRVVKPQQATAFQKFEDDHAAAAAVGVGGRGGVSAAAMMAHEAGAIGMQTLPTHSTGGVAPSAGAGGGAPI